MRRLLLILGLMCSSLLHAETYSLLIFESPATVAERDDAARSEGYWSAYDRYAAELVKASVLRGGTALDVFAGSRPDADSGAPVLTGYFVIDVPARSDAERWAAQAPALAVRVEVRAHRSNPHMTAR
jgi:hypothetical protein